MENKTPFETVASFLFKASLTIMYVLVPMIISPIVLFVSAIKGIVELTVSSATCIAYLWKQW